LENGGNLHKNNGNDKTSVFPYGTVAEMKNKMGEATCKIEKKE
jgi:hypothetical protein